MEKALRRMKWRKAEGSDGVVVEMAKVTENFAITKSTDLANKIYRTGNIPERMEESQFIVIPKTEGAAECGKHRIISILNQMAKITLKVIDNRCKSKVKKHVDGAKFCFRRNKGTGNAIFVLKRIIERAIEKQKDFYGFF